MSKADDLALLERIREAFGGEIAHPYIRGSVVAGETCEIYIAASGGIVANCVSKRHKWTDLSRFIRMSLGLPADPPIAANDNSPMDLWAEREKPSLPTGLLPPVIEAFALERAEQMGVDAGGLAMAALVTCAAAIPDDIKLQVKRHDPDWRESARLWVALIGNPSTKKTPTISTAVRPLREIDGELVRTYMRDVAAAADLPKDQRIEKPKQRRALIEDTTVESAQEVLRDNPQGLLLLRDELSGWFGSMERYGGSKGSAADRAFWLEAFNGGAHTTNRVGRGLVHVPNLSVSLLGGIQPEPIRAIANDMQDDGLLQRILPVVLGNASVGRDEPLTSASGAYSALVVRLYGLERPRGEGLPVILPLRFDDDAQAIRNELEAKHHAMASTWESVNKKLAAHVGKYDSFFARLCIVFHCIEAADGRPAPIITEDTARRASAFLHAFLFKHALAFYGNILGLSDRHDSVLAVAGFILAHKLKSISVSIARRGDRTMRKMDEREAVDVLSQLDAFGWLTAEPLKGNQKSPRYAVSPAVHALFEDRADEEAIRRDEIRETIRATTT
ncbi:DUF3987 domain-containing protein [Xanthobacteraceae bacterium A53D]